MRLSKIVLSLGLGVTATQAATLPVYSPHVTFSSIYSYNPAEPVLLKYNHDVDIVAFKGRFFAAWNANAAGAEDVPGQFNFLSVSDDFEHWSTPVRMFTKEAGAANPVESDNQWQPNFINWRDQRLYCAWSDFVTRRVFVAQSDDGLAWRNVEVPNAPAELAGKACGFPTNHGLITRDGVLLFPCSLPFTDAPRALVGHTRYAGVLRSTDGGKTWTWSKPIEAITWSQAGENPAEFGGETITMWEPMLFQQGDGTIGLLIRNSTAQENPERAEKPHRMLLYATSSDQGVTWTRARPVEVDTICSRNFTVGGIGTADGVTMIMNDNNVRVPKRISYDRYFLSMYISPVDDPDLLLPGPVVQPDGGRAFYPNGFVKDGKLYLAYTYQGIHTTVVDQLPDFSRPFLLPRGGRPGLRLDGDIAYFAQPQSTLGVVLTPALSQRSHLRLGFDLDVHQYTGTAWTVLTLGGKTRDGTSIRAIYRPDLKSNVLELQSARDKWTVLGTFQSGTWNHIVVEFTPDGTSASLNGGKPAFHPGRVLRKIAFGGLYEPPEWPMGMNPASDLRLRLDTIELK